ncbi:MAG: hypothetical protein C4535_05470 [Comamonadaceae bacterium]|nr:MAG: hypothetical protein C4535_05470 [Comamonadaceae bacterium]
MTRLIYASLWALGVSTGLIGPAAANDDHIATFKNVSGDVKVERKDATLNGGSGMKLFVSDRILSGDGAAAGIAFKDGTLLTVGPSADLQVRDYAFEPKRDKYAFFVYLAKGAAIYSSGMMAKLAPESIKVATPIATIGVRGTRFIIEADKLPQ